MGSAMDLDLPISVGNGTNGTYGCTDALMAYDEVISLTRHQEKPKLTLFQGWTPRHHSGTYSLQLPDAEEKNSHPRPTQRHE
jgi:hypothetical protein